jgi:hypothetical protein
MALSIKLSVIVAQRGSVVRGGITAVLPAAARGSRTRSSASNVPRLRKGKLVGDQRYMDFDPLLMRCLDGSARNATLQDVNEAGCEQLSASVENGRALPARSGGLKARSALPAGMQASAVSPTHWRYIRNYATPRKNIFG